MAHARVVGLVSLALAAACGREADIRDEPVQSFVVEEPPVDLGEPLPVDVPLGPPAFPACEERSDLACYGDLDFPCGFDGFVSGAIDDCQNATGCNANGDVVVTLGLDGCAATIAMNQPEAAFVACLAARLGATRCPCDDGPSFEKFLGIGNAGCGG